MTSAPGLFAGNTKLKKVKIGAVSETDKAQTTALSYLGFAGCSSLKTVEGLGNVNTIGAGTFSHCTSLEEIDLDGVEKTDYAAFQNTGLKSVVIPKSLSNLGTMTFGRCLNLTEMTYNSLLEKTSYKKISDTIGTEISSLPKNHLVSADVQNGDVSFEEFRAKYPYATPLRTLKLGLVDGKCVAESVENFGTFLSVLERVEFPEGMKKISTQAFIFAYNLKEVILPESLEEISPRAFMFDTKVDVDFSRLKNLKSIGHNAFFVSGIYGNDTSAQQKLDFPDDRGIKEAVFADGLETIGEGAFFGQKNLTRVFIPKNTKSVAAKAFQFTNNLAYVDIESPDVFDNSGDSVKSWNDVFWNELRKTGEDRLVEVKGIKNQYQYFYRSNVETVSYAPSCSLERFCTGDFAEDRNLRDFVIPSSVKTLDLGLFRADENLETMVVPKTVELVMAEVFAKSGVKAVAINNPDALMQEPVVYRYGSLGTEKVYYMNDGGKLVTISEEEYEEGRAQNRYNLYSYSTTDADYKAAMAAGMTLEAYLLKYLEDRFIVDDSVVIYGYAGSTAQKYAKKHGNPFVVITKDVDELVLDKNGINNCESDARFTIVMKSGEDKAVKTVSDNTIPAKGHRIVIYSVGREATKDFAGRKAVYRCAHCHDYYEDAEGLKPIEDISKFETVIPKIGETDPVDPTDPTDPKDPVDPIEPEDPHKPVKVSSAKAATCTGTGAINAWYCEHCNKYFSDSEGTKEISKSEITTPAMGHDWDEGSVTKEPTATEAGTLTHVCRNDSRHTYDESIDPTGRVEEVKIGTENFTITFDMGDGTTAKSVLKKKTARTYSLTKPTKEGYTFKGWYLDGKKITSISAKYIKEHDDIVVTATWAENKYTIKYSVARPAKTAKVTGLPRAMSVYYSEEVTLATNITAKNKKYTYTVVGWKDSKGNKYTPGEVVKSLAGAKKNKQAVTLKPIWEKIPIPQ